MLEIGQGFLPKPLQRPHPPIVVTAVAPFSKGVTEAAARGWEPISANFLMPEWVKSHWPKYVEGCERAGRTADPANWRVAKSDLRRRRRRRPRRPTRPTRTSPYRHYYSQLFTKLKKRPLELFKTRRDQPDDEVTLDGICDELIIWGTPDKVADEILKFRERVGDFGTLLYAGKDWRDPALGQAVDDLAGREGDAQGQRRDRDQVNGDLRALRAEGECCDVIMTWTSHLDMSVSPHSFKLQLAVTVVDFVELIARIWLHSCAGGGTIVS